MPETHTELLTNLLKRLKAPPSDVGVEPIVALDEHPSEKTVAHAELPSSTVTKRNIFRHPDAQPLILDLLLLEKYGVDWMLWEAETLEIRVPQDFGVDRISDLNVSKLQSLRTLHLVDTFWQQWEIFVWCSMPLNGIFPDFTVMQVPTVIQSAIAVDTANRIRSDMSWSSELKVYLSTVHLHDGILVPQAPLDFVEVETTHLAVDVGEVIERWPQVRASRNAPTKETPEDEQLRRMLEIYKLQEDHRASLQQQMGILREF